MRSQRPRVRLAAAAAPDGWAGFAVTYTADDGPGTVTPSGTASTHKRARPWPGSDPGQGRAGRALPLGCAIKGYRGGRPAVPGRYSAHQSGRLAKPERTIR